MPYVYLDDRLPEHPKIIEAGGDAAWLHVCAIAWCRRQMTKGKVPKGVVPQLSDRRQPLALARRLVAVGLWEELDGGFRIHDYEQFYARDESRRQAAKKAAEARWSPPPADADALRSHPKTDADAYADALRTHAPADADAYAIALPTHAESDANAHAEAMRNPCVSRGRARENQRTKEPTPPYPPQTSPATTNGAGAEGSAGGGGDGSLWKKLALEDLAAEKARGVTIRNEAAWVRRVAARRQAEGDTRPPTPPPEEALCRFRPLTDEELAELEAKVAW